MKYFSLAAHNRELVVIPDMETFAHYFCYSVKQKKGEVPGDVVPEMPEEIEDDDLSPAFETDRTTVVEDDDL